MISNIPCEPIDRRLTDEQLTDEQLTICFTGCIILTSNAEKRRFETCASTG